MRNKTKEPNSPMGPTNSHASGTDANASKNKMIRAIDAAHPPPLSCAPQLGHDLAFVETSLPHSLHFLRAIIISAI